MAKVERSGGKVNYYLTKVPHPRREGQAPYQAECEDIIAALDMTFDEGCIFKALWRSAAARQGNVKDGHDAVYDAEKMVHYSRQTLTTARRAKEAAEQAAFEEANKNDPIYSNRDV